MFSRSTQSLLVQARVEELHRVARTSKRPAAPPSTLVRGVLDRVFEGGRGWTDEAAAMHRVQIVGHPTTTDWSRRC
jgi:hypothetical protein